MERLPRTLRRSPSLAPVFVVNVSAFARAALVGSALGLAGCDCGGASPILSASLASSAPGSAAPSGFLKGQLHAHSDGSGDSDTPPEDVAAWYAARGYDFIVFTDHNRVTDTVDPPGMLTLPGVELTQNLRACDPPPAPGDACLLHMNALFVEAPAVWGSAATSGPRGAFSWSPPRSSVVEARAAIYAKAVAAAGELGGMAQLNHPNFNFAADASVLADLARRGVALVEIANQAVDSANEGDVHHPPVEVMWDEALSRGERVFGTATDDAHHYFDVEQALARGETAYVGDRGFVMVRAEKDPEAIRAAVARGDFYSSTGVLLDHLVINSDAIEVDARDAGDGVTPEIEVIGRGGAVLATTPGRSLRFDPRSAPPGYVRVRIHDARGRRAWTQPLFLP